MRTELLINDPKCESIELVPDEYKPKDARDPQPEQKVGDKDEVKIYPWDCGTPRVLLESEKLVPKPYRPRDSDSVQFVRAFDGDCSSESTLASQEKSEDIESVMRAFKRCRDNPNLEVGIVTQKHGEGR
ncbi:hypothetical protein DPSP01_002661 [Paraphaeosphaeria sporulosa]